MSETRCPCGRGVPYATCCEPLLAGESAAATAERLMRSRYTAFAVGDAEYLRRSWHPATRPASLELDEGTEWKRLLVERCEAGGPFDGEGTVTFTAIARVDGSRFVQRERSRFARSGGQWVYVDGTSLDPEM